MGKAMAEQLLNLNVFDKVLITDASNIIHNQRLLFHYNIALVFYSDMVTCNILGNPILALWKDDLYRKYKFVCKKHRFKSVNHDDGMTMNFFELCKYLEVK